MNNDLTAGLYKTISAKTGTPYYYVQVKLGQYELRGYPSPIEVDYLQEKCGLKLTDLTAGAD